MIRARQDNTQLNMEKQTAALSDQGGSFLSEQQTAALRDQSGSFLSEQQTAAPKDQSGSFYSGEMSEERQNRPLFHEERQNRPLFQPLFQLFASKLAGSTVIST